MDEEENSTASEAEENAPVAEDPRDAVITQLTAALTAANGLIVGLKAANSAMLMAMPGQSEDDGPDPTPDIEDKDEPDFDDLFKEDE